MRTYQGRSRFRFLWDIPESTRKRWPQRHLENRRRFRDTDPSCICPALNNITHKDLTTLKKPMLWIRSRLTFAVFSISEFVRIAFFRGCYDEWKQGNLKEQMPEKITRRIFTRGAERHGFSRLGAVNFFVGIWWIDGVVQLVADFLTGIVDWIETAIQNS